VIYRVQVDCWYATGPKALCERRIFLVEANNIDAARVKAVEVAESTAACSHRLTAVEWRSTHPLLVPLEVYGGAKFFKPSTFRNLREPKQRRKRGRSEGVSDG
jgi:hypothetical protein